MHFRAAILRVFLGGFAFFGFSFPSLNHILYIQEEGPGIILPLNRFFYSFCRPKPYNFLRPLSDPFLFRTLGKGTDSATPLGMEKYGRSGFLPCKRLDFGQNRFSHIFPSPVGSPFLTVILTVKLARLPLPQKGDVFLWINEN